MTQPEALSSPSGVAEGLLRYRHKVSGTDYVLLGFGKMQSDHWRERDPDGKRTLDRGHYVYNSVDMREVAIYRSVDDGSLWVRPREEFEDGRFIALATPSTGSPKAEPVAWQADESIGGGITNSKDEADRWIAKYPSKVGPMRWVQAGALTLLLVGGTNAYGIEGIQQRPERAQENGGLGAGLIVGGILAYALYRLAARKSDQRPKKQSRQHRGKHP